MYQIIQTAYTILSLLLLLDSIQQSNLPRKDLPTVLAFMLILTFFFVENENEKCHSVSLETIFN